MFLLPEEQEGEIWETLSELGEHWTQHHHLTWMVTKHTHREYESFVLSEI